MSKSYSKTFEPFARVIFSAFSDDVQRWAEDTSNLELSNACKMVIDAAKGGQRELDIRNYRGGRRIK